MPLTLLLLALAVFVMGTSEFMLAGLLPAIADDLSVSIGTAGLLTSAFAIGMVVGAPTTAALARRWPARSALLLCLLAFAVCHAAGALLPVFAPLLLLRILSALANAGFLAVALSTAASLVPADRTGRAIAVLLAGTTLATVIGVPAGSLLATMLGWRATFWAIALLCLPAIAGVLLGVRRDAGLGGERSTGPSLGAELARLRSPRLVLAMLLGALVNGGTFAAFTYLAPIVTDVAGLADAWVPAALVLFGIGSFLGVMLAGPLSDRFPGAVLAVASPLLVVGWVLLLHLARHPVPLLLGVLLLGMLSFAVGSTLIAGILREAAGAPTMAGSYATAALNTGAAAGPVLGALSLSAGSGPLGPIAVAAVLSGIALPLLALRRARGDGTAAASARSR
ncbi:Cmx/CmrA family chloramphenicol efflux MFS transporter [Brachybacterium hainanense]|uniref:Cmx/CmrA family chloramphenicol efflux MFS transporter n=1 Tax=Brachybacterium hainanense TaxID=1541174 RepID=A0ABV6RCE5_9MICO